MGDYRNYEVDGVKMYKSDFNINWIFKHLGRTPNVIMEFGSYDGGDGVFYKKTFPDAEVYSIEACDERYKVIQKLDEIFGIHTFNYAICEYDGYIDFYPVKDPNVMDHQDKFGSSGSINQRTDLYKRNFGHIIEQVGKKVPCIRLDTFCKNNNINHIDFLHVDVEGAEHRVISGLGELRPSILWLETYLGKEYYGENAYVTADLHKMIIDLGYEIVEQTSADTLYLLKNKRV
jgi:FkbM family methyltransferase